MEVSSDCNYTLEFDLTTHTTLTLNITDQNNNLILTDNLTSVANYTYSITNLSTFGSDMLNVSITSTGTSGSFTLDGMSLSSSCSNKALTADVLNANDYYAFGMQMPERSFNGGDYRYGFNGKEMDNEVSGNGNQYDYGFRIYNPRIARFLSVDPLTADYPFYTPYQFAGNTPIWAVDLDGLEEFIFQDNFQPYMDGINLIVNANEELLLEFNNLQQEKKSNIKVIFRAERFTGDFSGAKGATKDLTRLINGVVSFEKYLLATGKTKSDLKQETQERLTRAQEYLAGLGINPRDFLKNDVEKTEYFLIRFNTAKNSPIPSGTINSKGETAEEVAAENTITAFHEVLGHVLIHLDTPYLEHDYLYGYTEFESHYNAYELVYSYYLDESPSNDRVAPESVLGKIISKANTAKNNILTKQKITQDYGHLFEYMH
jgi:RHS repeat-associated protein